MHAGDVISNRVETVISARVPVLQVAGFDQYDFR